jgi:hypothetical protein
LMHNGEYQRITQPYHLDVPRHAVMAN